MVIFIDLHLEFFWKMYALWTSARKNSVGWFIVIALINTIGILEILYIFVFSKDPFNMKKDKKEKFKNKKIRIDKI